MSAIANIITLSAFGVGAYFLWNSGVLTSSAHAQTPSNSSQQNLPDTFDSYNPFNIPSIDSGLDLNIPDRARKYKSIVNRYASEYGVDPALIYSVIMVESHGDPRAKYKENGYYSRGLMQITPKTAKAVGHSGEKESLFNPTTNIKYGTKYLSRLSTYDKIGNDVRKIAAGYNAGPDLSPWPHGYVDKIMEWYNRITEVDGPNPGINAL